MELFRPIGVDWFGEGFWFVSAPYQNSWMTVNQYLSINQDALPAEPRYRLNKVDTFEGGVYKVGWQKAVTLDTFKKMKFDYIVASIPDHYREYVRLRNLYQPQAKVICQVGNEFDINNIDNILSSTKYVGMPFDKHFISYHQEFPLGIFSFSPVPNSRVISSFLHSFHARKDYPIWLKMIEKLPDWTFKEFGAEGKEDYPQTDEDTAQRIRESDIVVHFKQEGDGFGHIVHNVFAMGRVLITKEEYYKGKMAYDLMIDGVTCLFWRDDQSVEWNLARILTSNLERIGLQAHNRFNEVVNYQRESDDIKQWLKATRL
jgi:hypothetical protein